MSQHRQQTFRGEKHFYSYMMLLICLGALLGIVGIYLLIIFQALVGFTEWFFRAIVMSGG